MSLLARTDQQERLGWFHAARFGMFVHWGPYAVAGRAEWILNRERIPLAEYDELFSAQWNAENYDPRVWCRLAKEAGMGYVVLTTRHHDGFCLWDSQTTPRNAASMGPKRDLVVPFVEACREFDLKVGFYYSFADWSHRDYPGPFERDWPAHWPDETARQRFVAFTRAQLEELLTRYGRVDYLWYDGCIPDGVGGADTNALVYGWQPDILINERAGIPFDVHISEQAIKPAPQGQAWEACLTLNKNWGFHAGDHNWKTPKAVVSALCECASGAGNLLLNIGPHADGSVPSQSVDILRSVGEWLHLNGEFLSRSSRCPFSWNTWGKVTTRGNTVFLHIFESNGSELCLAEIANRVLGVRRVDTGEAIVWEQRDERLFLRGLPEQSAPIALTLAIELEGEPRALKFQTSFWIPG